MAAKLPPQGVTIASDFTSIVIYFQYMLGRPVFDALEKRQQLMRRLNQIPGFVLRESSLSKRPQVPLDVFSQPEVTDAFLAVMDWFVTELPARGVDRAI